MKSAIDVAIDELIICFYRHYHSPACLIETKRLVLVVFERAVLHAGQIFSLHSTARPFPCFGLLRQFCVIALVPDGNLKNV